MSSTVLRHPGPLHHPGPEAEVEVGDAAGCHPEGVAGATTMEARPGVGVAAAMEGDVVEVGVAPPSTSGHESRRIATTDGSVGRRCPSTVRGAPHCRHHAYQYRHDGLQGWRRTRSLSHVLAIVHAQHGIKQQPRCLTPSHRIMARRRRQRRVSYRRRRRHYYQRGEGLLSFLIPLAVAAGKELL